MPATRLANFSPAMVEIDPTTVCNLRCVMCHNATGLQRAHYVDMATIESVRNLSLRSAHNIKVNLTGSGEFFCHPQWREILATLSQGKCDILIFTNGLLLEEKDIDFIWDQTSVVRLNVSVDAASEKTYRRIRGEDFIKLTEILKRIGNHKNKRIFSLSMCIMKSNMSEMVDFCDYAAGVGADGIIFQAIHDREYTPITIEE